MTKRVFKNVFGGAAWGRGRRGRPGRGDLVGGGRGGQGLGMAGWWFSRPECVKAGDPGEPPDGPGLARNDMHRSFAFLRCSSVTRASSGLVWNQLTLLTYPQKVNGSLMLCHNAYVIHLTASHR